MKKTIFLLLAVAAIAAASAFGRDRVYQREFPVDAGARFSLDSYKGTITIRTDGSPTIRARARIHADSWIDPTLIDCVQISEHASRSFVSIKVDYSMVSSGLRRFFSNWGGLPQVDWDIMLPDDAGLALKTYKSEISLDVPSGRAEIDSYKGTGTIRGVRNRLKLDTYKGNFYVEVKRLGDLDVQTYKGRISLDISGARDFSLRAKSHKGKYRFTGISIPVERRGRKTEVNYTSGSARNRINIETHKGAFNVDFR